MTTSHEYLSRLSSTVIHLGLAPVTRLLESLENPQNAYPSVLIAGTNGKGSIAATMDSILCRAGFKIGLYTSPHLIDLRERIRVNGEMITKEALNAAIDDIRHQVQEDITYFEVLTVAAFLHFYRTKVDLAILEVGMGGRLDATNVVKPLVSVISNISLEHREYLGESLSLIAREKAGIIKEGGICVTAAKQRPVLHVLEETCRKQEARLYRLGAEIRVRRRKEGTFDYHGIDKDYFRLSCSLKGSHQIENAALALSAVEELTDRGFPVGEEVIREGLEKTHWEGRLEILRQSPTVIVDGGHNPAGISALSRALKHDFSYRRLILVFGVLADKDYGSMLKKLAPLADAIIVTRPKTERAVTPEKLIGTTDLCGKQVEIVEQAASALQRALELAARDDLVCVTGSLYLVGEIKEALAKMRTTQKTRS